MSDRFDRQSFLGTKSAAILDAACMAIVGLGGGGSHVLQQLAHVGVGHWILCDPDQVDESNLNRLVGATEADAAAATPKTTAAERLILGLNRRAHVTALCARWQEHHLRLREADVIVGCIDSFSERFQLESAARSVMTPYIDLGMDVFQSGTSFGIAGQVALSMPGFACLKCMGIVSETHLATEQYGAAGGRPQVVWSNGVLASAAVGLIVNLLKPWFERPASSALLRYDGNSQTLSADPWLASRTDVPCPHFLLSNIGDPFFALNLT